MAKSSRPPSFAVPAEHRVSAGYLAGLCKLVAPWEVPEQALLSGLDLPSGTLGDPKAFIPLASWLRVLQRAVHLSGEPALGIYAGLRSTAALHGFLGFGALSAANLQESIRFMMQFAALRFSAIGFHGHVEDGLAVMTLEEKADFGAMRDVVLLSVAISLWQSGSVILGRPMRLTLDLPIPRPDYFSRFEHVLLPTRFDRPRCQLTGPADGLQSAVTMTDAATFEVMRSECERLCAELGLSASLASRLRNALPCEQGFRTFDPVARELGLSPRTLRRRLRDEGLSFADLVDEERKTRALVLLGSATLSVDEVASKLGYADASTFTRAFRRWVGCSPAAYRRAGPPTAKPS